MTGASWTPSPGAIVFLPEEPQGFTEAEAYAFLMGGAPAPQNLTAAADVHDGAMIALVPSSSDISRLAVPDGEPIEQLHVTMLFLGPADDIDEETQRTIIDAMKDLAQRLPIVNAEVFSFSVFNPGEPGACLVAGLTGSELEDAHDSVEEFLGETGLDIPDQHEPWIPHCTLVYDTDPERYLTHELMMQSGPVTLDKIRVAFGGVVTDIPLGAAVVASADEVFHLAGKHDQHTHGHSAGAHASIIEVQAAGRLNGGKKLDLKDPEQRQIAAGIAGWTHGGNSDLEGGEIPSPAAMRDQVAAAMRDPSVDTPGGAFVRTVGAAPGTAPTLHRGMHDISPKDIPVDGDVFDLGPTSFTSSSKVRDKFATPSAAPSRGFGGSRVVHYKLESGSHSLRVDKHAGDFSWEDEHVAMGRYRVKSRTDKKVKLKTKDGDTHEFDLSEIVIEQISFDTPISRGRNGVAAEELGSNPWG